MTSGVETPFTTDYTEASWWWHDAPPRRLEAPLPATADVVIVGGGFTGLNAALDLARAGRSVVVLDADAFGSGASGRNAGFVGRVLKHPLSGLIGSMGEAAAVEMSREADAAYRAVLHRIKEERFDCALTEAGRLVLAYTERQLATLVRELALRERVLGEPYEQLDADEVAREVRTDRFVGGARVGGTTTIHPGLYAAALLEAALAAGATALSHTAMTGLAGERDAFVVSTGRGQVRARDLVVATNGYPAAGVPGWFRRRVVPFEGFMLATEPMEPVALDELLPGDRPVVDGRTNLIFLRRAPDGRSLLFGSRAGMRHRGDLRAVAAALWSDATTLMPGLAPHRIRHCWSGKCAGTFDLTPHLGVWRGIYYAMGYNFSGIAMGTHFGRLLARAVSGKSWRSVFASPRFPTMPLYTGNPWFLPAAMAYFDYKDRKAIGARVP